MKLTPVEWGSRVSGDRISITSSDPKKVAYLFKNEKMKNARSKFDQVNRLNFNNLHNPDNLNIVLLKLMG